MSKGTKKYLKKKITWFIITLIAAILLNFFLPRLMRGGGNEMLRDPIIRPTALTDEAYTKALEEKDQADKEFEEKTEKNTAAQTALSQSTAALTAAEQDLDAAKRAQTKAEETLARAKTAQTRADEVLAKAKTALDQTKAAFDQENSDDNKAALDKAQTAFETAGDDAAEAAAAVTEAEAALKEAIAAIAPAEAVIAEAKAVVEQNQQAFDQQKPEYDTAKKAADDAKAKADKAFATAYKSKSDDLAKRVAAVWPRIQSELKPMAYETDEAIGAKIAEIAGEDEWLLSAMNTILGNTGRRSGQASEITAQNNVTARTQELETLKANPEADPAKVAEAEQALAEAQKSLENAHASIKTGWEADCDRFQARFGIYHDRGDVSIHNLVNKTVVSPVQDDTYWTNWLNYYDTVEKDLGRDGGMLGELWGFVRHIFDGTFGKSTSTTRYPNTVSSIISEGIIWTICLQIPAILLGWILGNLLGAVAAYRRKIWDKAIMPASLFVSAIPAFGSAVILLVIFGVNLKWFPFNRAYDSGLIPAFTGEFIGNVLWHYQLPFWSIVLIAIGGQAVGMRSMSIYELNADYVKYSRFLGIKDGRIVRYVFRNAMLPQVTGLAMSIGTSIGGALVAETIFSYPGLGMKMYAAISENDYNTVSGIALIITVMVLIASFLLDLIYAVIDPRVKAAQFD